MKDSNIKFQESKPAQAMLYHMDGQDEARSNFARFTDAPNKDC